MIYSIFIATFALLVSHIADWQLQCYQHGWRGMWNCMKDRAPRAAWYIEWFPRDAWHWAQVVRNWGQLGACIVLGVAWPDPLYLYPPAFVALYAITRGAGFTLPRKLTQGY